MEPKSYKSTKKAETPAEKMNTFRPIMWLVGAFIFAYAVYSFVTKGFLGSLNMNFVIFLFVGVNCFLFPEPHQWMEPTQTPCIWPRISSSSSPSMALSWA